MSDIDTPDVQTPRAVRPPKTPMAGKIHSGPIHSSVAGRTDHLPMEVPEGSYVLTADLVSGMGEGNTIAGYKHLKRMFSGEPYGGSKALAYGQGDAPYNGTSKQPYAQGDTPYGMNRGGTVHKGVPIVAAGGEYVLTPDQVREAGDGDLDRGHRVLDKFMTKMRKELIKTLRGLDPPKTD